MAQVEEKAKTKVKKFSLALDEPGRTEFLLGNEAIARGAIEAGVQMIAAYPGTPSSEILENLARVGKEAGLYAQWATNEKVGCEVAMSASMAGLRAMTAMKHEGMNVALDFVWHVNLTGLGPGALVIVCCGDPGGLSSTSEQDQRWVAITGEFPLLEPATAQEAKDMTKWAFELSEELRHAVIVRSVTRISHASAPVTLGEIKRLNRKPYFDPTQEFSPTPVPQRHLVAKEKLERARKIFESSPFNFYTGPKSPKLTIICSGTGYLYSLEAIEKLGLEDSIGILKLGTTWPLPVEFIQNNLKPDSDILIVEEVAPCLETTLKSFLYTNWNKGNPPKIYGKDTGHIPAVGELNPDVVIGGLTKLLKINYQSRDTQYDKKVKEYAQKMAIERSWVWCPGCPHRATFWTIKDELRFDTPDSFVCGDIGCYAIDRRPGGQRMIRTQFAMGTGSGLASGFGKLDQFGYEQPVIAVCGDSTFFHAAMPAIVNVVHHNANATILILDNSATGMTGFQPHPGTPTGAMGEPLVQLDIEKVCRGFGCTVEVVDPFDTEDAHEKLERLMHQKGAKILIMRRRCALLAFREEGAQYRVWVDRDICLGEDCDCDRYCNRIFKCPALIYDFDAGKAVIDEALCVGCGYCVNVCPKEAIQRERL